MPFAATAQGNDNQSPPPIEAYGELPAIEDIALSPDGDKLAALGTWNGQRQIFTMDNELHYISSVPVENVKIRRLQWANENTLLVEASQTQKLNMNYNVDQFELYSALLIDTNNKKKIQSVFQDKRNVANAVFGNYGVRKIDGKWKAYYGGIEMQSDHSAQGYVFVGGKQGLYEIDLADNHSKRVDAPSSADKYNDWLIGTDGKIAAELEINKSDGKWQIKNAARTVIAEGVDPHGTVSLVTLGNKGDTVIYSAFDNDDERVSWYELPLSGNGETHEVFANEDIERIYTDPENGRLTGYLRETGGVEPVFFDADHQKVVAKIFKAFKSRKMRLVDWTPDFQYVLVRTSGNHDSGSWFFVDTQQLRAEQIALERPAIPDEAVGKIEVFAYKASDGLDLDGILTLPVNREAKNLPAIMLPHGGPRAHDDESFDWWAQALAAQGYAVFQPNFRGSTNRDLAFIRAGDGQWGRKMQSDISDGLQALAEKGIIDPERVCIMGASYGGYAALAGVTMQKGFYQCAVAVAPVSDVELMYQTDYKESGNSKVLRNNLQRSLGPKDAYRDISPRRFAQNADAPILLMHGRDDTVVPYVQSSKMADALKDAHKPYEFIELKGEDHWLSRAETRKQMLTDAIAFVKKNNPPN
ncbi:prolyl oligopeptidase family serine peptidase [Altererythrobacter indicus]|uniref:Prolyl oligopeptidase family serine peptidase n=2 Tax=Altericroceibacterium indicum TaxID=374177 RepID=A0A845A685_9SPHN|nr:prolyl oligopeptidase family serine peptidase [Altericroceibacterium indicum]